MKNQMKNKYCLDEKDWQKAKAALLLAKNFGLILDDTLEALEERRKEKNEENRHKQEKGELFYGPYFYTPPMYLQYELTRFRLDFVQPSEKIKQLGVCPSFTRDTSIETLWSIASINSRRVQVLISVFLKMPLHSRLHSW